MPSTVTRFSFARMSESSGVFGFPLDFATATASSTATGTAAANVRTFLGAGCGTWWRSTGDTSESIIWDRGAGTLSGLTWFHVAGMGTWGTLSDPANACTLTLKTGTTTGVSDGLNLTLTHSGVTDDWYATFASDTNRYVKLFIDAAGTGTLNYFQIARASAGGFETFDVNFLRGYSVGTTNGTIEMANAHGSVAHRYVAPLQQIALQFGYIGGDDLTRYEKFRGYAGANRGVYAPESPLWVCLDPSFAGGSASVPPMFARVVGSLGLTGTDAAGALYQAPLALVQVGK